MKVRQPAGTRCRRVFFLLVLTMLGACASGPPLQPWSPDTPETAVGGVPYFPQDARQCGPATLAEVLAWSGVETTPAQLEPWLYVPEKGGSLQPEMLAAARRSGRIPYVIPGTPAALLDELRSGHPVLILQNNGLGWFPFWHYAVVVAADGETVTLRSGDYETLRTDADVFMRTWQRADYWAMVALPENRLPASVPPGKVVRALNDYAAVQGEAATAAALGKAFVRWPQDPEVALAFGNFKYGEGDTDRAISIWRSGLAGGNLLALRNNLAWALAERGDLDEASALIEPYVGSDSGFADQLRATLAFIRCRAGGGNVDACIR